MDDYARTEWTARYHVPRSQVWEGSRGGQRGNVHLHLPLDPWQTHELVAVTGRRTTISRRSGAALCGVPGAWYDRPPTGDEDAHERCARCAAMAYRYDVTWPHAALATSRPM